MLKKQSGKQAFDWPLISALVILGPGVVLILLSVLVFRGASPSQQQAANAQPPSAAVEMTDSHRPLPASEGSGAEGEYDGAVPESAGSHRQAAPETSEVQESFKIPSGKVLELADLVELVGPSVVQVNVIKPDNSGNGSGFVLDKDGTIVTNVHVIEDAISGTIVFSDKTTAPIIGYLGVWPKKDIALVRVECSPDKLQPLQLAAALPRQGERVAAFGSPLGLQQSVSEGIVSAIRESAELQTIAPIDLNALLIQMTAPISPGNSGGPLLKNPCMLAI